MDDSEGESDRAGGDGTATGGLSVVCSTSSSLSESVGQFQRRRSLLRYSSSSSAETGDNERVQDLAWAEVPWPGSYAGGSVSG